MKSLICTCAVLAGLRGPKPTVAVSNTLMASAAYWLASAARQNRDAEQEAGKASGEHEQAVDVGRARNDHPAAESLRQSLNLTEYFPHRLIPPSRL